jgi:hypothetical protein
MLQSVLWIRIRSDPIFLVEVELKLLGKTNTILQSLNKNAQFRNINFFLSGTKISLEILR